MALPTLSKPPGASGPVYLRRLQRLTDWGDAADEVTEERVARAVRAVFLERDRPPFSFWRVDNDNDLRRAALAFNSNTQSLKQKFDYILFTPDDLRSCGISLFLRQTDAGTSCPSANLLHFDLETDERHLTDLCRRAMAARYRPERITEGQMKDVVREATEQKCRLAASGAVRCGSQACRWSWLSAALLAPPYRLLQWALRRVGK